MKSTIIFILILISVSAYSQAEKAEIEFRKITGNLIDDEGVPFPGQSIIIRGTTIGTQTDFDGNFCLTIPKNMTVFISLPFCFDQILREIKPSDENIKLKIGKEKRKTRKATRNWNKIETKLTPELREIYNSDKYKNDGNICG